MDSVSQIVLGAAVGELVLGKKIGNRAMVYGAVIATLPDLDIFVSKLFDPITGIEIHRGLSHSIVFFLLLSPILGFLLTRFRHRQAITWREATLLAFWCLFTHALLDAFTTWGTQLFWPHPARVALKSIFVVDPLYTLPFLYCLVRAMRLERADPARRRWNLRGLGISCLYLLVTLGVKLVALQTFDKALAAKGISYTNIIVKPSPFNIILWNANVATPEGYWLGDYSFFDSEPITFDFYPNGAAHLRGIENTVQVQQLMRISEGWYVVTKTKEGLYFNDLRFGLLNDDPKNPQFSFSYELTAHNGTITAHEVENKTRREGMQLVKRLFKRILGN